MTDSVRRVAITGAAGYVAGRLIERLERDSSIEGILATDIRPLDRQHSPKVIFRQHDVTTPMADLFSEHSIEAVVHLAYVLNPGHNRAASERVNVGGTINVLDACGQVGVQQIVYLSSTSVYGAHPDNPPLLTEESPVRPVEGFQYSEHKARAESLIREFVERYPTFTATTLRACPVMGPNADNFISRVFSKPFLVAIRGHDPPMQFLHEDDLTDILFQCLMRRVSGTYNLAGDGTVLWSELSRIYGRRLAPLPAPLLYGLTGLAWTLRLQSDSPSCGLDMIRYPWNASTDKIRRELGLSFQYSSKEAWESFVRRRRPVQIG